MAIIIGIDIGTTNIEYCYSDSLADYKSVYVERNPLTRYGLDVMTRITKANNGLLDEMTKVLRGSLKFRISELTHEYTQKSKLNTYTSSKCSTPTDIPDNFSSNAQRRIRIAANTTMVHILMNYDCTNLGSFPFTPVHIEEIKTTAKELGIFMDDTPVTITPGLSAFVGGDIVSGLNTIADNDNYLLIDLGTNAEMVLVSDNNAYITSAAAGPAFETCSYGHATDAVDGLVTMLETGIIDETGLLKEEYFEDGYTCNNLFFSQKKIRDFQMAKSAIRTGIDLLLKAVVEDNASPVIDSATMPVSLTSSGADLNCIKGNLKIYIAGTFGSHLNISHAIHLGMFPEWFEGRCEALGNTSLEGTLTGNDVYSIFQKNIREIVLANLPDFNDYYISNMNF